MHGPERIRRVSSAAAIALIGPLLLAFAGCGGAGDNTNGTPDAAAAGSQSVSQESSAGGAPASSETGDNGGSEATPAGSQSPSAEQPSAGGEGAGDASTSSRRSPAELPVLTAPGSEPADSKADSVSLMIKSWEETQKFIASQDADLIVVDFWSTSCVPCLREFPHLVELYEKYHDRGVQCISVSCDYEGIADMPPESLVPPVLAFLRKQRATFPNILLSTPSDEFYGAFDLGSIPAVAVYARGGKLLKRFDNDMAESEEDSFTYQKDVIPFVEQQLMQRDAKKD